MTAKEKKALAALGRKPRMCAVFHRFVMGRHQPTADEFIWLRKHGLSGSGKGVTKFGRQVHKLSMARDRPGPGCRAPKTRRPRWPDQMTEAEARKNLRDVEKLGYPSDTGEIGELLFEQAYVDRNLDGYHDPPWWLLPRGRKLLKEPTVKTAKACALPGALSTRARDRLPERAFGLPKERKYPMYTMSGGKLVPSGSHAANAKARAQAQYDKGNLTLAQLRKIDRKADKVLAECKATGGKRGDNPHGSRAALRRAIRRDQ